MVGVTLSLNGVVVYNFVNFLYYFMVCVVGLYVMRAYMFWAKFDIGLYRIVKTLLYPYTKFITILTRRY